MTGDRAAHQGMARTRERLARTRVHCREAEKKGCANDSRISTGEKEGKCVSRNEVDNEDVPTPRGNLTNHARTHSLLPCAGQVSEGIGASPAL